MSKPLAKLRSAIVIHAARFSTEAGITNDGVDATLRDSSLTIDKVATARTTCSDSGRHQTAKSSNISERRRVVDVHPDTFHPDSRALH